MTKRLDGKVAVVTASTDGIGYAIAESLAQNGARVVVSSRKESNVQKAVQLLSDKRLDVIGCVCHVGKEQDRKRLIQKAIDTYGKIDVLVSNAGISPHFGSILDIKEEAWDKIFDVNVKAGFFLAKEAMPHLQKTKGSVLFISSMVGYIPSQVIPAYSISKTALLGLTKTLALDCAGSGVRVNCLAPGVIKTKFSAAFTNQKAGEDYIRRSVPLNRTGMPSEIGGAAVFLSSDEASYITGETIVVAGGVHARL